jgi:TIR domain
VSQSASDGSDSHEPIFFLSYARTPRVHGDEERDPNRHVARFFFDLSEHINQLIYRETGVDAGSMDQAMDGSERWNEKLLQDLGTCRCFVALVSPRYVKRPACGMEWGAFERRIELAGGQPSTKTGLFPVRWVDVAHTAKPKRCAAVQEFSPGMDREGALYVQHGLYGLRESGRPEHESAYRFAVWQLARQIRDFYYSARIPSLELKASQLEELPDVFKEEEQKEEGP